MKFRQSPDDFRVDEVTDVVPQSAGRFALYRLRKRDIGTPEAVDRILRHFGLPRSAVSYGGLKDRHAVTTQHLTIRQARSDGFQSDRCELQYLGRLERPFGPQDIRGNRFQIVLRSLSSDESDYARSALPLIQRDGVPNYFDDQRFGSVGRSGEFIARHWIGRNYERALWLAFAEPNSADRSGEKRDKQILRDAWGDWKDCKSRLTRSHRRSIVSYLADHPDSFRKAWARVRVDMRRLYLSAWQSHLWNQMLQRLLVENVPPEALFPLTLKTGSVPLYAELNEDVRRNLSSITLQLPSRRVAGDDEPTHRLLEECLATEGLAIRDLRVRDVRDCFFARARRRAIIIPEELSGEFAEDELAPECARLTLQFTLPAGSYATIVVKRLTRPATMVWPA